MPNNKPISAFVLLAIGLVLAVVLSFLGDYLLIDKKLLFCYFCIGKEISTSSDPASSAPASSDPASSAPASSEVPLFRAVHQQLLHQQSMLADLVLSIPLTTCGLKVNGASAFHQGRLETLGVLKRQMALQRLHQ